jgi:hypothetical protein
VTLNHDPIIRESLTIAEKYADGWERRALLSYAAQQIESNPDLQAWFRPSPPTCAVNAVNALCRSGTDFDPSVVLDWLSRMHERDSAEAVKEASAQRSLLRDIFGNPFRPVTFSPEWRTDTAVALARQMYDLREFGVMPILADALQDAGCDNDDILNHCRHPGEHVRGCWVIDLLLGKV